MLISAKESFFKTATDFDTYCLFLERIKDGYDIHSIVLGLPKTLELTNRKKLARMRKMEGLGISHLNKLKKTPGINIVVYDAKNETLIDSVCFDVLNGKVIRNDKELIAVPCVSVEQIYNSVNEIRETLLQGNKILHQKIFEMIDGNKPETIIENRRRFHASIPKAQGRLRLIQLIRLFLLTTFDKLCRYLNISYFLSDGTFLGAWRTSGFIPWDDDVDVGIFPDGFKKLCEFSNSNQNSDLPKIDLTINGVDIGRFTVLGTTIGIDVFVYGLSDDINDEICQKIQHFKKSYIRKIESAIGKDFRRDREKAYVAFNEMFAEYSLNFNSKASKNYVYGYLSGRFRSYIWPGDVVFPLSQLNFEGTIFPVPHVADEFLPVVYGKNYWELPDDVYCQHSAFEKFTFERINTAVNTIKNLDLQFYQRYIEEEWKVFKNEHK